MIMVRGCGVAAAASCYEEPYAGGAWQRHMERPAAAYPVGHVPAGKIQSGGGELSDRYRRKSS